VARGGYVLADPPGGEPEVILIATGSEVAMTVDAYERLTADGIRARVVSMPSMELFDKQPRSYRDEVLPPSVTARVSVEKGSTFGWDRWVGPTGAIIGMSTFGASAPLKVLQAKLGFTVENSVAPHGPSSASSTTPTRPASPLRHPRPPRPQRSEPALIAAVVGKLSLGNEA
jgi:transketolase